MGIICVQNTISYRWTNVKVDNNQVSIKSGMKFGYAAICGELSHAVFLDILAGARMFILPMYSN